MLQNYLAAAIRNLLRNRAYAAINIVGLALGFAAAILIALYVRDEYSYDRFFPHYERTYKLDSTIALPGRPPLHGSQTFSDIAAALRLEFPAIEMTARLVRTSVTLRRDDIVGSVQQARWVDADFFRIFPMATISGDLGEALQQPEDIVLTRKTALRFFGRDDVAGENVTLNGEHAMRVAAVIEDLPSNTHLTGDVWLPAIASFSDIARSDAIQAGSGQGRSFNVHTYVRLRSGDHVENINQTMGDFVKRHVPGDFNGVPWSKSLTLSLSPVADAHLQTYQVDAMKPQGDPRTLRTMIGIAFLIIFVAASNFVSMMTARAALRAVEVGVRKAAGATRQQIIAQFLGECLLYALLALAVAILAIELIMPAFNAFLQRDIAFNYVSNPFMAARMLAIALVTGLAAGAYPALVLSRYRPSIVLKGVLSLPGGSGRIRQILVVCQFGILIALIVATLTVNRQTRYAIDERLSLPGDRIYMSQGGCSRAFSEAVGRLADVRVATCASSVAVAQSHWGAGFSGPNGSTVSIESATVDYGYFDVFGIKPLAGRLLAPKYGEDDVLRDGDLLTVNPSIVLNESAARALGFGSPQAAVGKAVRWARPAAVNGSVTTTEAMSSAIVGVVADFSIGSVRDVIEPTAYYVNPALASDFLIAELKGHGVAETLSAVQAIWTEQNGSRPFEGAFLSQHVNDLYVDVIRQSIIFSAFAVVALIISALGLLGLAAFTAAQRTREIGLRKVMGASRWDVLRWLGWQFARPVLWANLLAWPVAWLVMNRWLEGFAYHVDLSVLSFVAATALALLIALGTVAGHSWLVARVKPAEALRYE